MKKNNIKTLYCACCGGMTKGRQYWNQDTGYGICPKCVEWIKNKSADGVEYVNQAYGKEGYNYNVE